jgi:uncharacterized protein (DUF1684 family)
MKTRSLVVLASLAAGAVSGDTDYRASVLAWRQAREQRLRAPDGWLSVVGLFWLQSGANRFGADPASEIALPPGSVAGRAGTVDLDGSEVFVRVEPGVQATMGASGAPVQGRVRMRADTSGTPDVLAVGRLTLHLIERGGRLAIRVKDPDSPRRKAFGGLSWFDLDEAWRVEARFVPYDPPRTIQVPNVLGRREPMPCPGRAEFAIGGRTVSLEGVLEEPDAKELFFIFRDRTSGRETYGSGRFLYAERPRDGKLTLDFNRAYSPPCAFTAYATCPLPPPQNVLPVAVTAGEKAPAH